MNLILEQLAEREVQKSWSKLANYFTLMLDIAKGGQAQTEFILQNYDYVTTICDVMLGQKSPKAQTETEPRVSMGSSLIVAPFSPLVSLACHLIRSQRTKNMT